MDRWVGVGHPTMRDNGVAVVSSGQVLFAVSEERLSRVKQDAGTARALGAAPAYTSAKPFVGPQHHRGHALVAHAMSPFDTAISIVADSGESADVAEQTSVWVHRDGSVTPLTSAPEQVGVGPGRWWRTVTDALGWDTHGLPGNTMALAGYGGPELLDAPRLWDEPSGTFDGRIVWDRRDPVGSTRALWALLARYASAGLPDLNSPAGRAALARYLQVSLEDYLVDRVQQARAATGIQPVCLGGGVALNCVAAAVVAARCGGPVYVSPVPGNVGQPLGAALWAREGELGWHTRIREAVFLGPEQDLVGQARAMADPSADFGDDVDALAAYLAERLAGGAVVAVCRGRSEFGARALGHRSVLCDPCSVRAVSRVKAGVKRREEFMPLAPVLLESVLAGRDLPASHTMSMAPVIPQELWAEFGATIHVDGTARVQIAYAGSLVERVLGHFAARTGRRVLVNTSFNRRGEPIVETGHDAVAGWRELDIDVLAVEGCIFDRTC